MSPLGDGEDGHPVFVSLNAVEDETWADFFARLRAWFERLFGAPLERWQPEGMSRGSMIASSAVTGPRAELFHLAGRYWERRWLLLMEELLRKAKEDGKVLNGRNRINCENRWHRYAMLTPCLVATAHTAPKRFDYYRGPREDIHNKTLVVDDEWIVEGSFNWLSAVRDPSRPFSRHEVSLVYEGSQVSDFGAKAWKQVGGVKR